MSLDTPEQFPLRRFLLALVAAVCRHPRLVLALATVLALISTVAAVTRLEYHTSRNDLVSARKDHQKRWQRYLAEFGDDDDIVVVVQGSDRERMKLALDAVAARLASEPELFDRLFYKVDLRSLQNRALLLAPREQVEAIQRDHLAEMKPLLDNGPFSWHALGVSSMLQEARQRLQKQVPGQPLSPGDERFLGQVAQISKVARDCLNDPDRYSSPWGDMAGSQGQQASMLAEPHYFFSGNGALAFLLVRPVKEAGSFTAALRSVARARQIVAELQPNFADLRIGLTGLPVLETDEMVAAEADTRLAFYLAVAGLLLLFFVVYRGLAYPALTVVTLLVGTAWAFGWLTLTVGHLNILSSTFAVMLIGMGDYGVLWVMRYEHARKTGLDVRSALLHTTTHVAIGNLTAASTLALAFFAALFADFKAVGELGWIAGWGVLLCAFACFTVLPALLMLFDRRGDLSGERAILPLPGSDIWLPTLSRRPILVSCIGLLVCVVVGSHAWKVRYDHNLLHLQAEDLDSVQWEMTLIQNTSGASWHALSYTASREEALALAERYKRLPGVSQVIEIASLAPPDQDRKMPLVADIQRQLERLPKRGSQLLHAPSDLDVLKEDLAKLREKLASLAQAPPVLIRLNESLGDLSTELNRVAQQTAVSRLQRLDQRLAEDLAENLHRLREVSNPQAIHLEELPLALRERYVGKSGAWLLRVFARDDLWNFEPLEQFTKTIHEIDPEATGKPFGTFEGLEAMKNGLIRAGFYAFAVIVLVLWLDFRRLGSTLLAILPLLLGVLLSVGVLGMLGWPLNPANMIAFPLILGVGVDNGVHVLHDYFIRRREGRTGISRAIGQGVLVKALTTMIGFAALMISTERGLAGLGFILTLGVGCSMMSALVLLPATLKLLLPEPVKKTPAAVPQRQAA